jgi:hypothetical protein
MGFHFLSEDVFSADNGFQAPKNLTLTVTDVANFVFGFIQAAPAVIQNRCRFMICRRLHHPLQIHAHSLEKPL